MHNAVVINRLKTGIWLYLLLLIFEGALRKWFLPFLSTPLLIVRDPLALWLLLMSVRYGLLKFNPFLVAMMSLGIISFITALLAGHGNLPVAIYGARIFILQFPLIVVIGSIFDRSDILRIGKFMLYLTPLMAVLIMLQFYSPQSAWINRGVGGDTEGAGFDGALGYFRPPATFSFTNGTALFFAFATPYVYYFWFSKYRINKLLLLAATLGILMAIPFSISRTLFFSIGFTSIFVLIANFFQPRYIGVMIIIGLLGLTALTFLSNVSFFETATGAFTSRFETANEQEGGMVKGVFGNRLLGSMLKGLSYNAVDYPFFGYGVGMGTNVGAMLMSGKKGFLIAEDEWSRLIGEMGPLLGVLTILVRLLFCGSLFISAFRKLSAGDLLPWLLLSVALITIPQGQWAQPTSLGFAVVAGGFVLASLKEQRQ